MKYYIAKLKCLFGYHDWKLIEVIYDDFPATPPKEIEQCKECYKYSYIYMGDHYRWARYFFLNREEYLNRFHSKKEQ